MKIGSVTVIDKEARRSDRTLRIVYYARSKPPLKAETFKNIKSYEAAHRIIGNRNKDTIKSAIYNGNVLHGVKLSDSSKPKKKKSVRH